MSNFESAEKAYTTALYAEGSAWKENEAYMESIEAHQAQLQQQWEQMVLSAPIEDLEKALLKTGTELLKFANSDLGQAIIKATALAGAFGILMTALNALIPVIIASSAAMLANPIFWGAAAIAGIVLLVSWIDKLVVSFDEAKEALEEANDAVREQEQTLKSAEEEVKNIVEQIQDLENKKLEITDPKELETLNKEEQALKRQEAVARSRLAIEQATLKTLKDQAQQRANDLKNKDTEYNVYGVNAQTSPYEDNTKEVKSGNIGQALTQQMSNIQGIQERLNKLNEELAEYQKQQQGDTEAAQELSSEIEDLNALLIDEETAANENAEALQGIVEAGAELDPVMQAALDNYTEYYGVTETLNTALKTTEEEIDAFVEQWGEAENQANAIREAFEKTTQPLSDIESNYDTLSKAVKEFNEQGGYSASTIKKLSQLDERWLALLQLEDGQLKINKDDLDKLVESNKQEAIATLQAQAAQDMMNVATGNFSELSPIAQKAISDLKSKTQEEAKVANEAAEKEVLLAAAIKARKYAAEEGGYEKATQEVLDMINAVKDGYSKVIDEMSKWTLGTADTATKAAGKAKDAWVQAFEEEKDALKNLLETDQITEYEYYQRLAELNEKYFGEISGNHEKYIKEYRENEEEIYKGMKEVYDKVRDYLKEAVEQGYEKAINALKKEEKKVLAEIKKQIEAIKKEKESVIKGIEKQIKALKKEKEAVQKYYNDQIDAIKRENEVLQEQNELLEKQQELQKAKQQKVMVMQNGRFQLTENESAVAQAEQNLSNYEDQLSYEQQIQQLEDLRDATVESIEERIEALEEYKEYMEEYYDEQIERMEEYYDQVQEQYELQIEALQEELDTFKEGYQKEEDLENARLASQVLGMNERKDLYAEELENLKNYINEVNRMLASLGEAGVMVDFSYSPITGYHTGIAEVAGVDMALETRASGDASFGKDEVALVGESPNAELLLGSHVNTVGGGKLMHLQKGTGIVNAESTQTLAGILNGLSTPSTNVANNRSTQQNFSFGTISLPNVTDADSFVNTLSHKFNNYAIQYGNTRK